MEEKHFIVTENERRRLKKHHFTEDDKFEDVTLYVKYYDDRGVGYSRNIQDAQIFNEVPEKFSEYRSGYNVLSLDSNEVLETIFSNEKELKKKIAEAEREKTNSENQLTKLSTLKEKVREARTNLAKEISDKLVNF